MTNLETAELWWVTSRHLKSENYPRDTSSLMTNLEMTEFWLLTLGHLESDC